MNRVTASVSNTTVFFCSAVTIESYEMYGGLETTDAITQDHMPRLHLVVHGRVQGIFFRGSALELARELGLVGWVRNRLDGTVELLAEGDAAALAQMRAWCAKGPRGAVVRDVEEVDEPATGEFSSFGVRGEA
jgi:acylphosphatase